MTSLVDIRSFMLAWWSPQLLGRVEALIDAKIDARLVTLGLLAAPGTTSDKPGETGATTGDRAPALGPPSPCFHGRVLSGRCWDCGATCVTLRDVHIAENIMADYRGVPASVVLAAGRKAVAYAIDSTACMLCSKDPTYGISRHDGDCPLRDVGPEAPPSGDHP
jgi:hypothetical protein